MGFVGSVRQRCEDAFVVENIGIKKEKISV
jgi:hypothetical protein